jgi:alkyl hydroperoxide reductase subunit AhpC
LKVQINANTAINIQAITILVDSKQYHVQWKKIVPTSIDINAIDNTLIEEPGTNATVEIIASDTAFDTFTGKSFASAKTAIATFLTTKYKDVI